ncbi:dienelactone hydrolase family protein [Croceiramulus getboli]|nr:dienelactone hydrolase family protein [Flavobacteriaceae bacterium YJPT1-3]
MKSYAYLLTTLCCIALFSCKEQSKTEANAKEEPMTEATTPMSFAEQLDASPRHHEWVTLEVGDKELYTFVVYPEKSEQVKTVMVIHENRGLNDWARYFADQLAAKGYIVLAPDLLSNAQPGIEKTTDFEDSDAAREAIYALSPEGVTKDLDAVFAFAKAMDAGNGAVAVAGFCWGGSQTFRYATNNPDLTSAHVFYGTGPKGAEAYTKIKSPVYGYYGGNDNRVNSTIDSSKIYMQEAKAIYEPVIYEGAGHAFMRRGAEADSDAANKAAHDRAWDRLLDLLEND